MCTFCSFWYVPSKDGPKLYCDTSMECHLSAKQMFSFEGGNECEWNGDNLIEVRVGDTISSHMSNHVGGYLRRRFKTREKLVKHLARTLLEKGHVPNFFTGFLDMREFMLFTVDCMNKNVSVFGNEDDIQQAKKIVAIYQQIATDGPYVIKDHISTFEGWAKDMVYSSSKKVYWISDVLWKMTIHPNGSSQNVAEYAGYYARVLAGDNYYQVEKDRQIKVLLSMMDKGV